MHYFVKMSLPIRPLVIGLLCAVLSACALTQSQSFWASDRIAELDRALSSGDFALADTLIDQHDGTLTYETALDLAIQDGNLVGVERYLPLANVNGSLDVDGVTPIIRAVQSAPRDERESVVRSLLNAGAQPRKTDNFGRSAVNYASFDGNPALAQFLESGGTSYYNSRAQGRVEWLPELAWQAADSSRKAGRKTKSAKSSLVLRKSPLKMGNGGRPDLLFASAWIPNIFGPDNQGPYAGLRFHSDGTGSVMRFFPSAKRMEPRDASHLAWDFYRDNLYFVVLTDEYASYCRSTEGAAGRFGVSCTDYSAGGGDLGAMLNDGLSNASAKALLNSATQRARLLRVGSTNSVLDAAADRLCKPRQAAKRLRIGLPVKAAKAKSFGDWVVFDAARFNTFSSDSARVCTQRSARGVALTRCRKAGGSCRSVGGCTGKNATAVASVEGHQWAWLSCSPDVEKAKELALAKCRQQAGCDCQIIFANADRSASKPKSCRARS